MNTIRAKFISIRDLLATAWPIVLITAIGFVVASVAFLTAGFGIGTVEVDRFQNAKPMIASCTTCNR